MMTKKTPKNPLVFSCENCDFKCCNKKDFKRHLSTEKHKMMTNDDKNDDKKTPKNPTPFICECGKSYKFRQGLSIHKKKCIIKQTNLSSLNDSSTNHKFDSELVLELIKQNTSLQQQLIANNTQNTITNNTNNTNNTMNNSHNTVNNKFNINVFLNEQCKDAINFTEFINRISISHEDLENNAQLGFVNGITKIISDNLNQLTLYERPLHCTDVKRETLYIKDEDAWNKEKEKAKDKIFKGIQELSRKSLGELLLWKQENPEYDDINSEFSNKCVVIQKESISGHDKTKNFGKIMHNVCNNVHVDSKTV